MAKAKRTKVNKALDSKHFGEEPDLRTKAEKIDIIKAYNWYNYNHDGDQAKTWIIAYLKEFYKTEKELIKNANRIDSNNCRTTGWNCRILSLGGNLPQDIQDRNIDRIRNLAASASRTGSGDEAEEVKQEEVKQVISIQERIINRANDLIADMETELDKFYIDGTVLKASDWFQRNDVKPQVAQRIADYYKPLYSEVFDALQGKDSQLKEAYSSWKKPKLKAYVELVKSIISAAETRSVIAKASRKPRKKKEKPASAIVAKLKYKEKDETLSLTSVDPKQIIGSNQLWVYNTKYRTICVYCAMGPAGLSVKGSSITGFDEKTSIVKKLRKPEEQIMKLMEGGKIILRKFMDDIKCKPKEATGRINSDIVILRIIK